MEQSIILVVGNDEHCLGRVGQINKHELVEIVKSIVEDITYSDDATTNYVVCSIEVR
jgi:hypothetical protein